jgi:hypothetical protein
MKRYNLLFENVDTALEYDIEKCIIHQFGFDYSDDADITYKISVKQSKLSIERQTQLITREIITDTHLWNQFIPFIPKKKGVVVVASSMDYCDVVLELSTQMGYEFCYFHDIYEYSSCFYTIIGSDNLDKLDVANSSFDLFTVDSNLLEYDLCILKKFKSINILSPVIPIQLLKLPNVNVLDITELIVNRIHNDFYS